MSKIQVFNRQVITVCERSDIMDITHEDMEALKECEPNPYKGQTDEEFLVYLNKFFYDIEDGKYDDEDLPEIINTLHANLRTDVTRTRLWDSLEKSSESALVITKDGEEITAIPSWM